MVNMVNMGCNTNTILFLVLLYVSYASSVDSSSSSVYGVNNYRLMGNDRCANHFVVCFDEQVMQSMSPELATIGSFRHVVEDAVRVLIESNHNLSMIVVDGSSPQCQALCLEIPENNESAVWGYTTNYPARVYIKSNTLPSTILGQAYLGTRYNLVVTAGCISVILNNNYCWITDRTACSVLESPIFIITQIIGWCILLWVANRHGSMFMYDLVIVSILVVGTGQLIVLGMACPCIAPSAVMLHELGHVTCMAHPNQNVGTGRYFGNQYDPMSVMNSQILKNVNCMTSMDVMSLQNAANVTITPPVTVACLDPGFSSMWRLLIIVIICLIISLIVVTTTKMVLRLLNQRYHFKVKML